MFLTGELYCYRCLRWLFEPVPEAAIADLAVLPMNAVLTGDAQANNANNNVFSKEDVEVV
jgi:hypothetical protein